MTTEVWCKKCSNHGFLKRPPRIDELCSNCDAPLYKRRDGAPTPWNHLGAVVKALFSLRAVLFVVGYAIIVEIPHPVIRVGIAVLLFLAATAFATRAASVGTDRYIEFPHVSPEELLSLKAIVAMTVYVVVMVLGPLLLVVSALAVNAMPFELPFAVPIPVALALAGGLFLWSPMALVLYLRTNSVIGFVLVPQGLRLILQDIRGYLLLCLLVLSTQGLLVGVYVANTVVPFPISLLLSAIKADLILTAYACAGLYLRQNARVLDFPVDDVDWLPIATPIKVNYHDARTFRPTNPERSIELGEEDDLVPEAYLRTADVSQNLGSWPPSPVHGEPIQKQRVPERALEAGIAPLAEGQWLSGPSESDSASSNDVVAEPPLGEAPNSDVEASGPVTTNVLASSSPADVDSDAESTSSPSMGAESDEQRLVAPTAPLAPTLIPSAVPAPVLDPIVKAEIPAEVVVQTDPIARAPAQGAALVADALPEQEPTMTAEHDIGNDSLGVDGNRENQAAAVAKDRQLGRYTLSQKIAEGGMAEIFYADQQGPADYRKPVVIKRMRRKLASEPEVVQMFLDEARLGAQLAHPNIVQIIDFGEANGEYFIAMERLNGLDFGELLKQGPLPIDAAALMISQACDGLHFAHNLDDDDGNTRGVVHRDISPGNLFLARPGAVKVLDFGIARATERNTKTQTGMVKGKPAFMSPEQVRGQPLDGRSDVFSLGTTLFQMVTGANPFFRDSDFDTGAAVVQEAAPPLSDYNIVVPDGFESVLQNALRKHADRRYLDAKAFKAALRPFIPSGPATDFLSAVLNERQP